MGRRFVLVVAFLLVAGCGGGGSGGDGGPTPPPPPSPSNPDVVVLFVSGHEGLLDGAPSKSYLHEVLGPRVALDLIADGYWPEVGYYVDHPTATDAGGYVDLVADMQWIRDNWVAGQARPTRVIVLSHSHGGVWANAAIRAVPSLGVDLQVALDHSSYGWGFVGHSASNDVIGGDPRDAYYIETLASCPTDTGGWNEATYDYDLEDVVFSNVVRALEVRSGDSPPLASEPYDERWNARTDGSLTGLHCYFSATNHSEVHSTTGSTYPIVLSAMLSALP